MEVYELGGGGDEITDDVDDERMGMMITKALKLIDI